MAGISAEIEIDVGEFANSGEFCEIVDLIYKKHVQHTFCITLNTYGNDPT